MALIRDHQPARDPARLRPDFSSPQEEDAARRIVALLDGYTLAIEQAAVYLGTSGMQPAELLGQLQAQGSPVLDEVGSSPAGTQAILHKEKLAATIVDQTLQRLPARARPHSGVRRAAAAGHHPLVLVAGPHRNPHRRGRTSAAGPVRRR